MNSRQVVKKMIDLLTSPVEDGIAKIFGRRPRLEV